MSLEKKTTFEISKLLNKIPWNKVWYSEESQIYEYKKKIKVFEKIIEKEKLKKSEVAYFKGKIDLLYTLIKEFKGLNDG